MAPRAWRRADHPATRPRPMRQDADAPGCRYARLRVREAAGANAAGRPVQASCFGPDPCNTRSRRPASSDAGREPVGSMLIASTRSRAIASGTSE